MGVGRQRPAILGMRRGGVNALRRRGRIPGHTYTWRRHPGRRPRPDWPALLVRLHMEIALALALLAHRQKLLGIMGSPAAGGEHGAAGGRQGGVALASGPDTGAPPAARARPRQWGTAGPPATLRDPGPSDDRQRGLRCSISKPCMTGPARPARRRRSAGPVMRDTAPGTRRAGGGGVTHAARRANGTPGRKPGSGRRSGLIGASQAAAACTRRTLRSMSLLRFMCEASTRYAPCRNPVLCNWCSCAESSAASFSRSRV
jgi:hypothetical protein